MNKKKENEKMNNQQDLLLKSIKRRKLLVFKIISFLLPILFLVILETGLRWGRYGKDLHLVIESKGDKGFLQMNPDVSRKYFTNPDNATYGIVELFRKNKQAGTCRIFVLGESTTLGFPYTNNGSFHRWLKYRLMLSYPNIDFEIINFSLTAVNSYTVYDFAKQLLPYKPDAVLVYTGHNEYYGALGVGSTSKLGNKPELVRALIYLRDFKTIQLLENFSYALKRKFSSGKSNISEGLMERMAKDQNIKLGSKQYRSGILQFEDNMNELGSFLSEHKIPLFISNLVSNEKDMNPFISEDADTNFSANFQYNKGQKVYSEGNFLLAKRLFVQAKELDLLRFRAPEGINTVIEEMVHKYKGVYLVDSKSEFEKKTSGGILGKELLLEHVHPNLHGYAILSDAFYESLKINKILPYICQNEMSFEELLIQMPITLVDSLHGELLTGILKSEWPFHETIPTATKGEARSEEERIALDLIDDKINWNQAMAQLIKKYEQVGNLYGAYKISEAFILENPLVPQNYILAANHCLRIGDDRKAATYFLKAFRLVPDFTIAQNLFKAQLKLEQLNESLPTLDYLIQNNTTKANYHSVKSVVELLIKDFEQLNSDSENVNIVNNISLNYFKIGQLATSKKYATKALSLSPNNTNSKLILKNISSFTNHKN